MCPFRKKTSLKGSSGSSSFQGNIQLSIFKSASRQASEAAQLEAAFHHPSLPASGYPWSLKSLKQRVQKESEKEIQWFVICPVLCVVAHHLRMVQVIKHSVEFLPAVEKSLKAAQVDQIWSSCLLRNFYDLPSFLQLFRKFMLVCFNKKASSKMYHFQCFNL